jgi:hypothetical protein
MNVVDSSALQQVTELRDALKERGIVLALAHRNRAVARLFDKSWQETQSGLTGQQNDPTLFPAAKAFKRRDDPPGTATGGSGSPY